MNSNNEFETKVNREINRCGMAYRVEDTEGNQFVFAGLENGHPLYNGVRGSTHIFDLQGYKVIEKYLKL